MRYYILIFSLMLSTTLLGYDAENDGNNQNLTVSDISCLLVHNKKNIENEEIELYRESNGLRVQLVFYRCNPFMTGFDITPTMKRGNNGAPDSVSVNLVPVIPEPYKNTNVIQQWYSVSFTIHGVEADSFYFSCLWFDGQVSLMKGKSLALKDPGVEVTVDDVIYEIYESKHFAVISNGKNAKGELTIPSVLSYNGEEYPVKAIESQAFKGCSTLTAVTIPDSVIAIESEAFYGCSNLSAINNGANVEMVSFNAFGETPWYNNQPNGVVYFGKALCACKGNLPEGTDLIIKEGTLSITPGTFHLCKGLSSVTIPEGITNIESLTFGFCYNLVSVKLPESLTIIGIEAFRCCDKITSIHLPNNMKYVCSGAFSDCRSLTSINIPEGVESIDDGAFANCNNMATITLPESLKKIGYESFYYCKSLSVIKIPDNVEKIDEAAFAYCTKLNSLTLSEKLKIIGVSAFYACSDLSTIVCNAQVPPTKSPYMNKTGGHMSTDVFYNVDKQNCKLYVPQGCEEAYRATELWKDFNIIEMGKSGNNRVFLSQGTAWIDGFGYEQEGQYKLDDVKLFYYTIVGDTIIADKTYFKICCTKRCKTNYKLELDDKGNEYVREKELITDDGGLCFFMREDDAGNVWFYTEDKDVFEEISHNTLYEYMADDLISRDLFLFNAKKTYAVGDSMPLGVIAFDSPNGFKEEGNYWDIYPYEVKAVDQVELLDGKIYQRYNNIFLEGMGPLNGPLVGIGTPNSYNADTNQLFAFYRNGQLIYRNEGYLSALEKQFPDILETITEDKPNNIVDIPHSQPHTTNILYDLQGRRMFNAPCSIFNGLKKGIYIQNGKKIAIM